MTEAWEAIEKKYYLLAAAIVFALASALSWLNIFELTPDSANYLSAAQHYSQNGRLEIGVNWPHKRMDAAPTPYTDYPPALPLLTAAVISITGDLLTAAAAVQFTGILIFFLSLYLLFKNIKIPLYLCIASIFLFAFFPTFRVVYGNFWTEIWFLSLESIILTMSAKAIKLQKEKYIFIAAILGAISSLFKYIGAFNIIFPILYFFMSNEKVSARVKKAAICSSIIFLPVILWFARNYTLYGFISAGHGTTGEGGKALTSFFSTFLNNMPELYFIIAAGAIPIGLFIMLAPLINNRKRINIKARNENEGAFLFYLLSGSACLIFLGGYLFLGMFTVIDPPNHRMLAPSVFFGLIWLIATLDLTFEDKEGYIKYAPHAVLTLATVYLMINLKYPARLYPVRIPYPKEKALWEDIRKSGVKGYEAVITDYYFNHQLFSGAPQLMVWTPEKFNKNFADSMANKFPSAIFVFNSSDSLIKRMKNYEGYEEIYFPEYGYSAFLKK